MTASSRLGVILSRLDARDRQLFSRLVSGSQPSSNARRFWTALTHLGGARCTIAAATVPLAAVNVSAVARPAIGTLIVSHLVVQAVKRTVGRRRPAHSLGIRALVTEPDRFSFPSGHSAAAMSIALAYSISFPSLSVVLIPLAMMVGVSRVCLGVHYPSDVFVGQLIAALSGIALMQWPLPGLS